MAALHGVHHEQQLLLIAELPQPQQILRSDRRHSTFPLNSFHEYCDCCGRERLSDSVEIIERHMAKFLHQRLKPFLHLFLAGGGNRCQRAPVKGVNGRDNFEPALLMPKPARQLEQTFIRFGAAVTKEYFTRPNLLHERLRQPALRLVIVKIGNVDQLLRLFSERVRDFRIRMPQAANRNPASKVQVTFASNVVDIASGPVAQSQIESRVGRHYILLKERLNPGRLVVHDRWWA